MPFVEIKTEEHKGFIELLRRKPVFYRGEMNGYTVRYPGGIFLLQNSIQKSQLVALGDNHRIGLLRRAEELVYQRRIGLDFLILDSDTVVMSWIGVVVVIAPGIELVFVIQRLGQIGGRRSLDHKMKG